eukprot:scaffold265902_cov15-Tisochrysis_lutea.AAC.1
MASARVCMSTALAIIFLSLRPRFLAQIGLRPKNFYATTMHKDPTPIPCIIFCKVLELGSTAGSA